MRPLFHLLLFQSLLAALLPLAAVAGLSMHQYQKDVANVESFIGAEALDGARVTANMLGYMLGNTRSSLDRMADRMAEGTLSAAALKAEVEREAQIQSIVVISASGAVRYSDRPEPDNLLAVLPHARRVLDGQPVAYSAAYQSEALGTWAVGMAVPYRTKTERGVVVARMSTKAITEVLLSRLGSEKLGVTYITDQAGRVIAHPDQALVTQGRSLADNPPVAAGMKGRTGWSKFESTLFNFPRVGGHVPLTDAGWVVVSSRETGEAFVSAKERLNNLLLVAVLAALAAGATAWWWGRRIARPLESLSETMRDARDRGLRALPSPDLAPAVVSGAIREYHVLGSAYNALAGEVNRRFEENMAYQEELQAQNEELQAQNEEIQAQSEELQSQSEELQSQSNELQAQSEELQAQSEELVQQNEELARLSEEALAANKLKSAFLANMSHELRTPLNSIIGYTELVVLNKRLELPEKARTNLGVVLRNARHLLGLINDILDLSKVEAGKATLFNERLDPLQLVKGVVAIAEPMAREKGLLLVAETTGELAPIVTDETKARQIILNLVSNAIKFTREGRVTVRTAPAGPDRWMVEVADTGVGIASAHHAEVFEEFRQLDDSTTREAGGTGLGLAISRKLARLLGGELTLVASAPGEGSTFRLVLPVTAHGHQPAAGMSAAADVLAAVPPGKRVVVAIDDDPEMLHLITEKLSDTPYHVATAESAEAGLALIRQLAPYAVTLDVMMPRKDGWSVLRELKADPETAGIPVVLLSFLDHRMLGFTLGASAYLTKPVEATDLRRALDQVGGVFTGDRAGYTLVVDDDADARGLYRELLTNEGVPFREAADGREAIAAMEREAPALVILDLMMPHMDGFEVAAWMRQRPETRDVPVIVVTAKSLTAEDTERLAEVQKVIAKGSPAQALLVEDLRALLDQARGAGQEAR